MAKKKRDWSDPMYLGKKFGWIKTRELGGKTAIKFKYPGTKDEEIMYVGRPRKKRR